jgi:hypothetical protein
MSIYLFTGCALAAFLLAAFASARLNERFAGRRTFLTSFLGRLRELLLVGFLASLALSVILVALQVYYWDGATVVRSRGA